MSTELLVNAYYLQEEATRALRAGRPQAVLDEVLGKARALGATLVRAHGYNADPAKRGDSAIRWGPTVSDALAWAGLDHVLARARAHGLRLVLVLGNQWDDLGGARTYVGWAGLPRARAADPRFFTHPAVVELYEAHAVETLERRSSLDGLRYGEHPAIAGWELLNEPRGDGLDRAGHAVRAWIDRLARTVRSRAAPSQWVSSGEEGLDVSTRGRDAAFWSRARASWLFRARTSFALNARCPWLDVASVHVYPEAWGVPAELVREAGARMIRESAALARAEGKPLVVGELGVRNVPHGAGGAIESVAARRAIVAHWLRVAEDEGARAAGAWMLAHDHRPHHWDRYHHYVKDGLPLDHPENGVSAALEAWRRR
jgi:mannan endo-1,4-beta-mannosidase